MLNFKLMSTILIILVLNASMISQYYYKHVINKLLRAALIIVITLPRLDADDDIDKDHLKMYPYCGKLYGHDSNVEKSRIVNSRDSQTQYPWVVYLIIRSLKKDYSWHVTACSGTVITEK